MDPSAVEQLRDHRRVEHALTLADAPQGVTEDVGMGDALL